MNNEERDALARRLIAVVIAEERERAGVGPSVFESTFESSNGELGIVYTACGRKGQGTFAGTYWPLDDVRRVIAECERIADGHAVKF